MIKSFHSRAEALSVGQYATAADYLEHVPGAMIRDFAVLVVNDPSVPAYSLIFSIVQKSTHVDDRALEIFYIHA